MENDRGRDLALLIHEINGKTGAEVYSILYWYMTERQTEIETDLHRQVRELSHQLGDAHKKIRSLEKEKKHYRRVIRGYREKAGGSTEGYNRRGPRKRKGKEGKRHGDN